jgi:hypothetical protein
MRSANAILENGVPRDQNKNASRDAGATAPRRNVTQELLYGRSDRLSPKKNVKKPWLHGMVATHRVPGDQKQVAQYRNQVPLGRLSHISVRSTTTCATKTKSIATTTQMMLLMATGRRPIASGGSGRVICQRHRIATANSGKPKRIPMLAPRPFKPFRNKTVRA